MSDFIQELLGNGYLRPPKSDVSDSVALEENLKAALVPNVVGGRSCDKRLPNKPPPDDFCEELPAAVPS